MPPAADPPRRQRSRGFTLIETIVVLVILGLVAELFASRGPQRSGALEMQRATNLVTSAIRIARGLSIATAMPDTVRITDGGTVIQIAGREPRNLPKGILAAARAPLVFRPDGSSTGGTIALSGYGRNAAIEISWLDGRISFPATPQ